MSKKDLTAAVSQSICKAALEEYNLADDTLAELIKKACIEVRDFMLLSFVCDQERLCFDQIDRALGFESDETQHAVERLIQARLIEYDAVDAHDENNPCVRPTDDGLTVCKRILDEN